MSPNGSDRQTDRQTLRWTAPQHNTVPVDRLGHIKLEILE